MTLPRLRTTLLTAVAAVAAAAITTALTVAVLPAGPASAAPALSMVVTNGGDPGDPTLLDTGSVQQAVNLDVGVSESASGVHLAASGEGLVLTMPSFDLGYRGPGTFPIWLLVRATTPGFHTLTITLTADGAAPVVLTLDRLWAPGDTHLAATGSLAGQTWAAQVTTGSSRYPDGDMIWFLDADTAAIGNSRGGRPTCDQAPAWNDDGPCVSYAYDAATGLLELGRAIGVVRPGSIHLAGVGGDLYGGPFDFASRADFTFRLVPLRAGKRLAASFTFVNRIPRPTRKARVVTLRKDGTFALSDYYGKDRRGTYAIGRNGRIALRIKGLGTKLETLLVVVGPGGTNPKTSGAWMTTYEDEGRTAYTSSSLLTAR